MASPRRPASVIEYSDGCVRAVQRATGLTLDYTPETLPLLDHYLLRSGGLPRRPTDDPVRGLVAVLMGCYFGEVARRSLPCRWAARGSEPAAWRIEFDRCLLTFYPIAVAWEVVLRRETAGVVSEFLLDDVDREEIADRLAGLPGVTDLEYYSFTQRFETLGLVSGWLVEAYSGSRKVARREAQGLTTARYRAFVKSLKDRD